MEKVWQEVVVVRSTGKNKPAIIKSSVFLTSLFDFHSYRFLVPFYVKLNPKNNCYYLTSNIFQKILCGCFHTYLIYLQVSYIFKKNLLGHISSSILSGIFDFVRNTLSWIMAFQSMKMLWLDQDKVLQVLECLKAYISYPRWIKLILLLMLTFTTSWKLLLEIEYSGGIWHFIDLGRDLTPCYDDEAKCSAALAARFNVSTNSETWSYYTKPLTYFMKRVEVLTLVNIGGFFVFNQAIFLAIGLSLREIAKDLERNVLGPGERTCCDNVQKGIDNYQALKEKVMLLKQVYGQQLLLYYFIALLHVVAGVDKMMGFRNKSNIANGLYCIYFLITLSTWLVFSDYYVLVHGIFSEWLEFHLFRNLKSVNFTPDIRMKLLSMQNELGQGSLAISCRYFAISNGFLGQMLELIITYGIIVFQMRPTSN